MCVYEYLIIPSVNFWQGVPKNSTLKNIMNRRSSYSTRLRVYACCGKLTDSCIMWFYQSLGQRVMTELLFLPSTTNAIKKYKTHGFIVFTSSEVGQSADSKMKRDDRITSHHARRLSFSLKVNPITPGKRQNFTPPVTGVISLTRICGRKYLTTQQYGEAQSGSLPKTLDKPCGKGGFREYVESGVCAWFGGQGRVCCCPFSTTARCRTRS